jgi:acetolactate synthase-1/2/3 large subunit
MNNGHLGLVRQQQQLFYAERYCASRFGARPDFAAIARGFGLDGIDLGTADDPHEALARAIARRGPRLIDLPIEAAANVFPMVPPGAANCDTLEGTPS